MENNNYTCEDCMYVTERIADNKAGVPVGVTWYCNIRLQDLEPLTPACALFRWGALAYQRWKEGGRG